MELRDFAIAIEHGQSEGRIIGKGKRNYTLWEYDAVGFKIYYKFIKVLSSSRMVVEEGWPNIYGHSVFSVKLHEKAASLRAVEFSPIMDGSQFCRIPLCEGRPSSGASSHE
jgi:hypothetical protein